MEINQATLDLVKRFEGFRAETYLDSAGVPTIGYGTTARAGLGIVPKAGMVISEKQAEEYLRWGLEKFAKKIRPHITRDINENQFGAFVSLAYNIGPGAFIESTALRRFNDGDILGTTEAMRWWNKAGGKVLKGLVRRRDAEVDLFLTPVQKFVKGSRAKSSHKTISGTKANTNPALLLIPAIAAGLVWLKRKFWK